MFEYEIPERDDAYEFEMAQLRDMRRRQRLEWEEMEADRDYVEKQAERIDA